MVLIMNLPTIISFEHPAHPVQCALRSDQVRSALRLAGNQCTDYPVLMSNHLCTIAKLMVVMKKIT